MNNANNENKASPKNDDIYIPEKNPKSSPLWVFIKYSLIIGLVIFVSFFIVCSYQLGKIGK